MKADTDGQFFDALFAGEDPWHYVGAYEQTKYAHTLELVPEGEIGRALEIGCAEGVFTQVLAARCRELLAVDISATAIGRAAARCAGLTNVTFREADIRTSLPQGPFDLIVCSEVLYYLQDRIFLERFAARLAALLADRGILVMAHANSVSDDRSSAGFDFTATGGKFIGETFGRIQSLEFLVELRTSLYRIQKFRRARKPRRMEFELPVQPREVREREAGPIDNPRLMATGCAITSAEARYCFVTRKVPILMYHRIAESGPEELRPYRISPAEFERQMNYLHRHGYRTEKVADIWQANASEGGTPLEGRLVALTFDDAYRDFFETAWPVLRRYGFTATVCIPTDYIGGTADWDRHHGDPAPLMSWEEARELSRNGIAFAAHSCSHRSLIAASPDDSADEIARCRAVCEHQLGVPVTGFCYPYGDHDARLRNQVRQAGYHWALGISGAEHEPVDRFALQRIEISGTMDFDAFVEALPDPQPSPPERRAEYARLTARRDRSTYFPWR